MRRGSARAGCSAPELRQLARQAARSRYVIRGVLTPEDRVSVALVAMLERLAADPAAGRLALLRAANVALQAAARAELQYQGFSRDDGGEVWKPNARFERYWTVPVEPFADRVTERVAVRQVMAALSARDREVLTAVGDGTDGCYARTAVQYARRRALALWFSPEAPPSGRIRRAHYSRR
jgi:hypothetical protein